jgi:3-dehydroquinate dehydratase-2
MTDRTLTIHVLHGPNLNLLGRREPEVYGRGTLMELDASLVTLAGALGACVVCSQHNGEGALVDAIQGAAGVADGILINPAAYTHTSVAIRDALLAVDAPTVEVHMSNVYTRETFRHHSTVADVVVARVMGFGAESYCLALRGLVKHLRAD